MITEVQRRFLIDVLEKGDDIPSDFKNVLFPVEHKEYELSYAGKMRKEDLLANEDGTFPVPIQIDKRYFDKNKKFEDWENIIAFGDNLNFLKTIYANENHFIKDKVKGKVKLIYIDPPFSTTDEFLSSNGAKAYRDKKKGAEFIEFLRRRLILAKEILASDGSIYVHLDQKMVNHIRIIMDEVFGKECFKNAIIWHYGGRMMHNLKQYNRKYDVILYYTNSPDAFFELPTDNVDFEQYAKSRHEKIHIDEDGKRYLLAPDASMERTKRQYEEEILERGRAIDDVWEIRYIRGNAKERTGYPTQKPEELLTRIIKASSKEGDIVMDFFGGAGTTMAVAEKLNRKWIICDLGKLSYFTMQKRMLEIAQSKDTETGKTYNIEPSCFTTVKLGVYDLDKTFNMEWEEYKEFVTSLFEIEQEKYIINGIEFDGKKNGFPVKIFNYIEFKYSAVDSEYLEKLYISLKQNQLERIYVIAPATRVISFADYEEINETRFYFLKVPYEMIRELHKQPFHKMRQPQSQNDINIIDEMKGFQFVFAPEVKSELKDSGNYYSLRVSEFKSYYLRDEDSGKEFVNFETLSAIFIDYNYDGNNFVMDECYFADCFFGKKKGKKNKEDEIDECKDELVFENQKIEVQLDKRRIGKEVMVIYTDIYGNDFSEIFRMEDYDGRN